jgi:hypothetical protein
MNNTIQKVLKRQLDGEDYALTYINLIEEEVARVRDELRIRDEKKERRLARMHLAHWKLRGLLGIWVLVKEPKLRPAFICLVDYLNELEDEISKVINEIGPQKLMLVKGGLHATK